VVQADPGCGIAYWGVAMTHFGNPMAGGSTAEGQAAGWDAAQEAAAIGGSVENGATTSYPEWAAYLCGHDRELPPLFPPLRRRGFAEASLAAAAIAIAFLLVAGPQAAHIDPEADSASQQEAQTEETAASSDAPIGEEPVSEANPSATNEEPKTGSRESEPAETGPQVAGNAPVEPPPTAAKDPGIYTARAGDTFKSIAKRLYGATSKWRAIAELNPDLKSKKLRAGQLVNLPPAPAR